MADNETVIYYDEIAKGYNNLHKKEQINKFKEIKSRISIKKEMKLLDVGCGTCLSFDFFNCDVYGIEPSAKMVEQHINHHEWIMLKKLFVAPAEEISSKFNKMLFDIIICVTVAHHFTNIKKVFEGIKEVSKPESQIIFSILNRTSSKNTLKKYISDNFLIKEEIDEGKDMILFCRPLPRA